jgi:hypothetical protein
LWNVPCIVYDSDLASLLPKWTDLSLAQTRQLLVAHGKQKSGTRILSRFLFAEHPTECATSAACKDAKLCWLVVLDRRYSLAGTLIL